MRKTKIICTIGPACRNEETIEKMCLAGMNVARLNFSHGTHEDHKENIAMIKRVRERLQMPIAILLDTKGPEYRISTFKEGKVFLKEGDTFTFTTDVVEGNETRVSVSYPDLAKEMAVGDIILVNNGLLRFEVAKVVGNDIVCNVVHGGELSNRKSMSFPDKVLKQVYLSEQDKADILLGIENDVDFIACSFVSAKQDLLDVIAFLKENGGERIELIAKIENRSGVDNIEEICDACAGIMIGRGDMGVEIPFVELPAIQKKLITKCRLLGKRVITATEMLESMIYNPRPTRAEISDVANAVYDGTSAVMLSGETATGKYPVQAVSTMAGIAEHTENNIHYAKRFRNTDFHIRNLRKRNTIHLFERHTAIPLLNAFLSRLDYRIRSRHIPNNIYTTLYIDYKAPALQFSTRYTRALCNHQAFYNPLDRNRRKLFFAFPVDCKLIPR